MRRPEGPIDITFDFRTDTPPGKDPDGFSPTLRKYHKRLWSKPLPNGVVLTLDDSGPEYLHHRSEVGQFFLCSDTVIPTFSTEPLISKIIRQISPEDLESFNALGYTIGSMMLFPGNASTAR